MKQRMVELTAADILLAQQEQGKHIGHSGSCPIAQVLKRTFGVPAVQVDYDNVDIYPAGAFPLIARTTEPMRRIMRRWDSGREVSPTRFQIRWDQR